MNLFIHSFIHSCLLKVCSFFDDFSNGCYSFRCSSLLAVSIISAVVSHHLFQPSRHGELSLYLSPSVSVSTRRCHRPPPPAPLWKCCPGLTRTPVPPGCTRSTTRSDSTSTTSCTRQSSRTRSSRCPQVGLGPCDG